jgi:hypothetical protein
MPTVGPLINTVVAGHKGLMPIATNLATGHDLCQMHPPPTVITYLKKNLFMSSFHLNFDF